MSTEHSMTSIKTTSVTLLLWLSDFTGAPNENIVQNHLNISIVKGILLKRLEIGIFLTPIRSDFLAESLVIRIL